MEQEAKPIKELAVELGQTLRKAGVLSFFIAMGGWKQLQTYVGERKRQRDEELEKQRRAVLNREEDARQAALNAEKAAGLEAVRIKNQQAAARAAEEKKRRETPLLETANGVPLFAPIRVVGFSPIAQRSKEEQASGYHSAILILQEMQERGYKEVKLYGRRKDGTEYQWGSAGAKGTWLDIPGMQ